MSFLFLGLGAVYLLMRYLFFYAVGDCRDVDHRTAFENTTWFVLIIREEAAAIVFRERALKGVHMKPAGPTKNVPDALSYPQYRTEQVPYCCAGPNSQCTQSSAWDAIIRCP